MIKKSMSYNHLDMLTIQIYESIINLHYMHINHEEDIMHENSFSHSTKLQPKHIYRYIS